MVILRFYINLFRNEITNILLYKCIVYLGLLAEAVTYDTRPLLTQFPKPWPWLLYQTLCRAIEFIMGCAMASITKQPSVSPRHQYLSSYPNYSTRMKRGNNLYI